MNLVFREISETRQILLHLLPFISFEKVARFVGVVLFDL